MAYEAGERNRADSDYIRGFSHALIAVAVGLTGFGVIAMLWGPR